MIVTATMTTTVVRAITVAAMRPLFQPAAATMTTMIMAIAAIAVAVVTQKRPHKAASPMVDQMVSTFVVVTSMASHCAITTAVGGLGANRLCI